VTKNEVEIIYCSTGDMTADLLTKPLQGGQFKKFRDTVLNLQCDVSRPPKIHRSALRKGNNGLRDVRISDLGVS